MFNPQKTALTSDDAMHEQEKTIRQIIYRYYMVTEVTLQCFHGHGSTTVVSVKKIFLPFLNEFCHSKFFELYHGWKQSTMVVPWYYLQMIWRIVCCDCMYMHIHYTYILDLILMNVVQEITLVNTIANIVLIRIQ